MVVSLLYRTIAHCIEETFMASLSRTLGLLFDRFMDERLVAEVLWRGYFIDSKSWLVEAIENWMKYVSSDQIRSQDHRLLGYAKVATITFTVQAIEDFACMGYAYLRALREGPERIYEYVRDFAKPERARGGRLILNRVCRRIGYFAKRQQTGTEVGSVDEFFHRILTDESSLREVIAFEPDSQGLQETRLHLKSIRDFRNKYYRLYTKFKHGQSFVLLNTNPQAVYIFPDAIERKEGKVKLPLAPYLVSLEEWELAKDLIFRINGYFAGLRARSRKLFPEWQRDVTEEFLKWSQSHR